MVEETSHGEGEQVQPKVRRGEVAWVLLVVVSVVVDFGELYGPDSHVVPRTGERSFRPERPFLV